MANTPQLRKFGTEYGKSGTQIFKGIIVGEEYNVKLTRLQALHAYDIMGRSDADIHGALQVCKLPILGATWDIAAAKNPDGKIEDADQKIADQVKYELFHHNIDFDDLLYQALDMLDFGFSVFELVYGLCPYNGTDYIGFSKIAFRKQTTIWAWEMSDGRPGITQMTPQGSYDIPLEKLAIFVNKKRGDNWEGVSLLRHAYKDWDMKDKLTLVNAIALEKMAVGVPVIKEDPTATVQANETAIQEAELAMQEFRANEKGYIKTPRGLIIEMLDMRSATTKDVLPTLAYHKRAIFSSVLATFLDLGGSSGSGAKSLSKDLTEFFQKSEEYIAKTLRAVINKQIIKPLCDLNYSDLPNGYPELTYGAIGDDDITAFSAAVNQLMTAGAITPDAEMEDSIRTKLGLPAMPDDMKASYTEDKQAAKDALAISNTDKTTLPKDTKPTDKKNAALTASQEAQRKVIEVIFADED